MTTTSGSDDLTRPLGMDRKRPWLRVAVPWSMLLTASSILILSGVAVYTVMNDPRSGEPDAIAPITRRPAMQMVAESPAGAAEAGRAGESGRSFLSADEMEQSSGVAVVRGGGDAAPGAIVIPVPPAQGVKLAPAPDKRLVERSRHGVLPRIGPDGARPSQVYARPYDAGSSGSKAKIALLIGGLGISQTTSADAIARLPGAVSLAFAPYGSEIERQVAKARAEGHEVFLQVPMEPFDYPENDPGPHTLRADDGQGDNIDRLQWLMSRFPGFVGVSNFMGAKFTASPAALGPVLKELAARGLMFVDDGSSNRSLAGDVASGFKLDTARADLVADAVPRGDAIDKELARLESIARQKGVAIGSASALPVSVERIVRWARGLDERGFVLVPVSSAVLSGRKS